MPNRTRKPTADPILANYSIENAAERAAFQLASAAETFERHVDGFQDAYARLVEAIRGSAPQFSFIDPEARLRLELELRAALPASKRGAFDRLTVDREREELARAEALRRIAEASERARRVTD